MTSIIIVYDGECPLCQFGVTHFRPKEGVKLELLDARTQGEHAVLQEIKTRKLDLDAGMVAVVDGVYHHGADALRVLAGLGASDDLINRLNAKLLSSKATSRVAYPFLQLGRRMALWAKQTPLIRNLDK